MKASRIVLVCVCVLAVALAGFAQARPGTVTKRVTVPSGSQTYGKIDITFNINIPDAWIPSSDTISCQVGADVFGELNIFEDVATLAATRNGNTATCLVPMFYSWPLQNPGQDTIDLIYSVTVPASPSNPPLPSRQSIQSSSIPVPANGTVTRITITVTL